MGSKRSKISAICLQLSAVSNNDLLAGSTALAAIRLDPLDYVHSLSHTTEHDVLAVQPRGLDRGQKELASVGVGTSVGLKKKKQKIY